MISQVRFSQAFEIRREVLGLACMDTVNSLEKAALSHWRLREYLTAKSLFQLALSLKIEHFKDNELEIAKTQGNLGEVLRSLKKFSEAEEHLYSALTILELPKYYDPILYAQALQNLTTCK